MNNLSVIVEKEAMGSVKEMTDNNLSSDSGVASSSSSSGLQQGTNYNECPIIEFTALNLAPNVVQSTFLGNENNENSCNISAITPCDVIRVTLNSSDGKWNSFDVLTYVLIKDFLTHMTRKCWPNVGNLLIKKILIVAERGQIRNYGPFPKK